MFAYFDKDAPVSNLAGTLPHWRQGTCTYFVTFRTADSLPQEKLRCWRAEKEQWLASHPEPHDDATRREFYSRFPSRLQSWLDQGYGRCLLNRPELRQVVENALQCFDGERYHLDEFIVAGNHVHVLVTPKNSHPLSDILHSWKSFSGNKINRKTGQSGAFWQKESFDHIVRSPEQLHSIRTYIREHSVGAASSRSEK